MKKMMKQWTQIMMVVLFMVLAMNTKVFAADNSGTSFETAGNLSIGGQAYGSLTDDCQARYFTFTTSSNKSWYTITGINSSCDKSLNLFLYDTDKSLVRSYRWIYQHSTGTMLVELEPKTKYYVSVEPNDSCVGDFKLELSEIIDDYGDSISTGKQISFGQTLSGCINVSSDVDYFKFQTSSEENCYYYIDIINVNSDTLYCDFYDSDQVCIETKRMYSTGQYTITEKLDPNETYYLKISGEVGNYKIKVTKKADDAYDDSSRATQINLNKKYDFGIQASEDIDYFKFKTNSTDTEYTFQIISKTVGGNVKFYLYDANLQQQGYSKEASYGSMYKEKWTLKKNKTYYIQISGSGDYSVKVSCLADSKYKVTYKLNGGKNSSANPSTYTPNKEVKLKAPSKKGYKFAGWYTDSKLTKSISKIKKGSTGNYTLYAKWTKISLSKASIKSLKKSGSGKAKIVVNKVKTADGYEIVTAANKKMTSGKKTTTMSSTSKTLKLKKGKTYYVKVRAFSVDSTGKKIYGKYSAVKQLKL